MFPRRAETERAAIFENMPRILQFAQILFVNGIALALKIGAEIAADVRALVPTETKPMKSVVDGSRCFLGVARFVGVFDAQDKPTTMMPREKPVEEGSARSADMQVAGGRWRETNANFGSH